MELDYAIAARCLDTTQAHLLRGCLRAAGIGAEVADDHHAQANTLILPALGGVRVLVPAHELAAAREVLAAYERGEFMLPDDEAGDTGEAGDHGQPG